MNKGVKFRLYPNKQQKELLAKTFGCARLVYNLGISWRKDAYQGGDKINYSKTSAMLTDLKKTENYSFLNEVDSVALQQSLRDLDTAYQNFFSKRAKLPCFKSKRNHSYSYRTINQNDSIRIKNNHIRLPKIGWVKVKQSMAVDHINHAAVEQSPSGKYYIVLNVDFEPKKLPNVKKNIGLDIGIQSFCTTSDGEIIQNPKYLEQTQHKLAKEQKRLSRMEEGSHNWDKQRIKVASIHERITNQRNDFLQKLSTTLINENQVICVEDLQVSNMVKNHRLARSINSASWSKFYDMLAYKAEWHDRSFVKVSPYYPSSQICSQCGYQNPEIKDIKIRQWTCPICGIHHDRDLNAATNILRQGMITLKAM